MRELRSQEEIIKNWKGDFDKPIVTVLCTTYNHEKYIEDAIEGFLIQETNFPFEIIIHDDASTDKTAQIVREYEAKYPLLIKGIYQTKNRWSQGLKNGEILYPMSKGEYIALCEGDDYWTDAKKLQVQIDEMKKYPNVSISFHSAYELKDRKVGKILANRANDNKIFTTSEVISGYGDFCPTASLIVNKKVMKHLPYWYYSEAPVGDYFIQIFTSISGGALYINKIMSIYRVGETGGWSHSQKQFSNMLNFVNKMTKSLEFLNSDLEYKYTSEINYILNKVYWMVIVNKDFDIKERNLFYTKFKHRLNKKQKIFWVLIYSKPGFHKSLILLKNRVRQLKAYLND